MSWDANKDKCQKIYFGEPGELKPTREAVGEFIMNKMGEVYDDGPAWSEGVPKLTAWGMRYYETHQGETSLEGLEELEEERDKLKSENRELRKQLANREKQINPKRAVDRLQEIEAGILKVLCRSKGPVPTSPEFVAVPTIVQQTGLEYETVVNHLEKLARTEFGGYVDFDQSHERARATRTSAFNEYCEGAKLDTDRAASA